jgi:hypothetical protein
MGVIVTFVDDSLHLKTVCSFDELPTTDKDSRLTSPQTDYLHHGADPPTKIWSVTAHLEYLKQKKQYNNLIQAVRLLLEVLGR